MTHLFFDLDGTLADPAVGIIACIQHAIRALSSSPWPDLELRRFIGPPLRDSFREILATQDVELVETAVEHYRERYTAGGLFENVVYPGIPEALAQLESAGFPMWVVTSKPTVFATRILEHFGLRARFSAVYGSELSGERSTKSELIAHVLAREQIRPTQACMIGDRRHDIEGARCHRGVLSLGVLWGYGTRSELEAAGANDLVESVGALPAAVRRLTCGNTIPTDMV
jgi:phosphoglycolate phosphatase